MRLTFLYAPVDDLAPSLALYRDDLGWDEAWREGEDTVALAVPGSDVQLMLARVEGEPAGPMYLVDDVAAWLAEHPALEVVVPRADIPDGSVAGVRAPGGSVLYVFDQPGAAAAG